MATFAKKNLKTKNMNFQEHWSPWISVQYPGQTDRTHQDRQIIEIYSIRGSTQKRGIIFYDFMTFFLTNCTELKKTMSKNKVKLFP